MTRYTQHGTDIRLVDNTGVFLDTLPLGNYVVKELRGMYYLTKTDDFILPERFYGKHSRHMRRIMKTFDGRDASMGVMLSGIKGSGKSLLAKHRAYPAKAWACRRSWLTNLIAVMDSINSSKVSTNRVLLCLMNLKKSTGTTNRLRC